MTRTAFEFVYFIFIPHFYLFRFSIMVHPGLPHVARMSTVSRLTHSSLASTISGVEMSLQLCRQYLELCSTVHHVIYIFRNVFTCINLLSIITLNNVFIYSLTNQPIYQSVYLSAYLSIYLSFSLSICLFTYLSNHPTIYLIPINPSIQCIMLSTLNQFCS